jgi:hypothetical protein
MKKHYLITILTIVGVFTSCDDDYLDRLPSTDPTPETFFESEQALELYTNSFYTYLSKNEFQQDYKSDNMATFDLPVDQKTALYESPNELGSGGWSWTRIRDINFFIDRCSNASAISTSVKNEQLAIAKFFRAWFYFDKVKKFGDVPWYSKPLSSDDVEQLYKPRDSREVVMDSVLADIDFAVEHGVTSTSQNRVTKWTALVLKSRICLYEGTWRKYHTEVGLPNSNKFLSEAFEAAKQIIDSKKYTLYTTGDIKDYYNFFNLEMANSDEVIMAIDLAEGNIGDYNKNFTTTSVGTRGITKSLVHEYLNANGTPFNSSETVPWFDEFTNRDPRLAQTSMPMNFNRVGETENVLPWFGQNHTGYQVVKRVGSADYDNGDPRDIIVFRLAEVYLNYAEAKAELGTITQEDLDMTINELRDRVQMPHLTLAPTLDPYIDNLYLSTSNPLILEIRRERRVELAIEGFRFDDLMRWKEGQLLRNNSEGIYAQLNTYMDRDRDGIFDLYVYDNDKPSDAGNYPKVDFFKLSGNNSLSNGTNGRILPYDQPLPAYQDWEYLLPIPTEEITLNPTLIQNEGWDN